MSEEHAPELHGLLDMVMVRKRKSQVLTQLPPKRRSRVMLSLRPSELKKVAKIMRSLEDARSLSGFESMDSMAGDGVDGGGAGADTFMEAFRLVADAKMGAVCEWLETSLFDEASFDTSRKAIIFAHHHTVHNKLGELCRARLPSDAWTQITGKTDAADRDVELRRFQTDPRCRFAILAVSAFGHGLNLAVADTAVFAELCWTPATLEQAEARIHRIGQKASSANVYYLTAGEGRHSPDAIVFSRLVRKARNVDEVVDGGDGHSARSLEAARVNRQTPRHESGAEGAADGAAGSAATSNPAGWSSSAAHSLEQSPRRAREENTDADEHADEPAAARRRLELGSAAVTSPYFGSAPSGAATAPGSSVTAPWELSDDDDESAAGSARAHS